jgi:hypothetical protein
MLFIHFKIDKSFKKKEINSSNFKIKYILLQISYFITNFINIIIEFAVHFCKDFICGFNSLFMSNNVF